MLERVDRLKEPPIVGQLYLVPTVFGKFYNLVRDFVVIGNRHEDAEFFDFGLEHYHLDFRFFRGSDPDFYRVTSSPLHAQGGYPLTKPVLKRRKCLREQHIFDGPSRIMSPFRNAFEGRQCAHGKRGWVCPHRHIALGSTPAIEGVITCPLHGLRIDAETGKCLGAIA
jgi:hypothetical protein